MADDGKRMVQCVHCKYGHFMQWMDNPLICECERTHEREVAEAKRLCPEFERTNQAPSVTHFDSYDD